MPHDKYDLTGQTFGELIVISQALSKNGNSYWNCKCSCGNTKIIQRCALTSGATTSCGHITRALKTKENVQEAVARAIFSNIYRDGNLTWKEFYYLSQQNCFYCGADPITLGNYTNPFKGAKYASKFTKENCEFRYHGLDRVNNDKPHDRENVVSCCKTCNSFKLISNIETFYAKIENLIRSPIIVKLDSLNILKTLSNNYTISINEIFSLKNKYGENALAYKISRIKSNIKKNIEFKLNKYQCAELIIADCIYCGQKADTATGAYNGIDRIDSSFGYIEDNCTTACHNCNIGKNNLTFQQFAAWINRIKDYQESVK